MAQLAPRDIKILQNCSSLVSRSFVKIGAARHDAGCVSSHGGLNLSRSTLYPRVTLTIGASAAVSAWNKDGRPAPLRAAVFDNSAN